MAHVRAAPQYGGYGFDSSRSLLVVPAKRSTVMYLVAGADLAIEVEDASIALPDEGSAGKLAPGKNVPLTDWERSQSIRPFKVEGKKVGSTILNAFTPDRRPFIQPLTIQVVDNNEARQSADKGRITPELRSELQKLSFRDALIRVAEDQMNSAIGRSPTGGNGRYDAEGVAWCGSFIWWCYDAVSKAKGVDNPFGSAGGVNNSLRSGIKALYAGMKSPEKFTVIRYEGYDRFGGLKTKQAFIDISASNPVQRGDICLPRGETGTTFPHVCMVYDPPDGSGAFTTIDGNQTGAYRPEGASQECIGINSHDANKKMKDGKTYKFAFVHVKDL